MVRLNHIVNLIPMLGSGTDQVDQISIDPRSLSFLAAARLNSLEYIL